MEKTSKLIAYTLITCAFLLAGCAQRQQSAPVTQICVPDIHMRQAIQAGEDCLSEMHFTIDKADAEQGVVTTKPLMGAQWFEFWRSDNVGAYNNAEANIQDVQRTVELNITLQNNNLCINCVATVQRLSLPERSAQYTPRTNVILTTRTGSEQRSKSSSSSSGQKKAVSRIDFGKWIDLGRDPALETKILKRLQTQIANLQK